MNVSVALSKVQPIYRTYWRRIGAGIVDWTLVVEVPTWLRDDVLQTTSTISFLTWYVCLGAGWLAYPVLGHRLWGQTIGKWLFGVRVIDLKGGPLLWRQAIARECYAVATIGGGMISSIGSILRGESSWLEEGEGLIPTALRVVDISWYVLAGASMFLSSRRRALHDVIAGTVVVRTAPMSRGQRAIAEAPPMTSSAAGEAKDDDKTNEDGESDGDGDK